MAATSWIFNLPVTWSSRSHPKTFTLTWLNAHFSPGLAAAPQNAGAGSTSGQPNPLPPAHTLPSVPPSGQSLPPALPASQEPTSGHQGPPGVKGPSSGPASVQGPANVPPSSQGPPGGQHTQGLSFPPQVNPSQLSLVHLKIHQQG